MRAAFVQLASGHDVAATWRRSAPPQAGPVEPADQGRTAGSAPTGVGHSMVVSPYGEVLARLDAGEGTLIVDLGLGEVDRASDAIPVLDNRRSFS